METQKINDSQFIAQQLRKPHGEFAKVIGAKMNQVNANLYDFVLDSMKVSDNDHILEIGFGNGKFFQKLLSIAENLLVVGLDYSEAMISEAKKLNYDLIAERRLEVYLGDSINIPFPTHSFEKIFCNMVIYFWEEPEKHLKEIYRVLKPGGIFYTGIQSKKSMMKLPFSQHEFILYEEDDWKSILLENGFDTVNINKTTETIEVEAETKLESELICFKAFKG